MRRAIPVLAAAAAVLAGVAAPAHATLAYVKGALQGKPVVWVAADDGSGAHAFVTGGFSPKVSPDGTQVAFVTGTRRASLKVKPVAGGKTRTLATNVWAYDAVQWAPDSTKISVATGPELGPYTLKLVDLATGAARALNKGAIYGVSFAPGGEGLVWSRAFTNSYPIKANLYTTTLDGGPVDRLTSDSNATSPVWGPAKIAFNRARKPARKGDYEKLDIYTIDPDGTGIKRLTRTTPPFLLAGLSPLAWSSDGKRLAAQYGGQDTSEAWRVSADTGKTADATGKFDGVVGWGLARDGSALLATTGYYDNPSGNVVAIDWDGGTQTVLAKKATQPSWSR
ncbi:MAG: TolB protein [Solirubrobacterales bacterium]|nr:TolB protein [Solirubrobacterales bacterium]